MNNIYCISEEFENEIIDDSWMDEDDIIEYPEDEEIGDDDLWFLN